MPSQQFSVLLKGSDRRSIGRANEVAKLVLQEPKRFGELIKCLWHEHAVVRLRAADAAEKISVTQPGLLKPHKAKLLGLLAETEQIELRWHLAQMVPRLPLNEADRSRVAETLQLYLEDRSSIVRTFALQALADLSRGDAGLRRRVRAVVEESVRKGTAAMKARARKLLKELEN